MGTKRDSFQFPRTMAGRRQAARLFDALRATVRGTVEVSLSLRDAEVALRYRGRRS